MSTWLSSAAGAALVTGIFALIMWLANRKAAKNDKRDEKQEEEKAKAKEKQEAEFRNLVEKFNGTVERLEEFIEELGIIKADVNELKQNDIRQEEERMLDKAYDARRRILRFADEVRRGEKHSLEHFNNVFVDISNYEKYCGEHPKFKNNKAEVSIKCIQQVYEQCTLDNSFL